MSNKNFSKKVREYILRQCDLIDTNYKKCTDEDKSKIIFNSINNIESNAKIHLLVGNNIPDVFNFTSLRAVSFISRIQMYTDYYRSAKLQDKLYETNQLKTFLKVKSYDDIKRFSNNQNVQYEMLESLKEYYESSGYDKVLFNKCLDEKDIKHLKAINPFFEYEYDKSNVKIDLEFMLKNIKKWQKHCAYDLDISYDAASRFVFDLYKLNKEEAQKLLIELFNQDLGIISSTKENDEYIKIGNIILNIDNLSIMFKDYYKYQIKKLKYGKDDK